jgi:type I restriction enzyme S subunit
VSSFHDTAAAPGPGVVLGRKGVVGSVFYLSDAYWPHDTTLWVKDFHGNDPRFIYYVFRSLARRLATMDVGSANPTLNRNHVHPLKVRWPRSLDEQRGIATTLGALDDKIELNRRMSETLLEVARTLFRSMFVDCDPTGSGWRRGRVSDLCSAIFSGGTPDTRVSEYWHGDVPWLSSGETRANLIVETEKTITGDGVAHSSTRLAPALSTVIASAGQGNTRGQTSLLMIDSYVNQSVVALVADPSTSSPYHLFFDLERRYEEFRRVSDAHSSRGSLTTKLLGGLEVVCPPIEVVREFTLAAAPLVLRAGVTARESRTLASIRDALLPKLISGELRIPTAA